MPVPDDDELFVQEMCWQVSPDQCWKFEIDISLHDIAQWRNEDRPCEMASLVFAAKRQRSEVRLADLTEEDKQRFHQAKLKEIDSWLATETVAKVLRSKIPRENILRSRWILTWKEIDEVQKHSGPAKYKPKARLVVLGFEDPEVDNIPRDSPTMNKMSHMLILQYAASAKWDIQSFDIQTAFLRGSEQSSRVLGMEPPEEMRQKLKLRPDEIVQLLEGAHGRVDAPYLWFVELKKGLEDLGFTAAPFDPCVFVLKDNEKHHTIGLIGVHVDDGLCCGNQIFMEKLKQLEQRYPFGSHKKRDFTFTGLRISQQADYSITHCGTGTIITLKIFIQSRLLVNVVCMLTHQ